MKTTQKHYNLFCSEVKKWIDIFGLKDWQIYFQHKTVPPRARLVFDTVGCVATFTLATNWNELGKTFLNNKSVRRAGFHEVCELLLGRLNMMVQQRYGLTEEDVEEEIHRVIRILENTLWEKTKCLNESKD